MNSQHFYEQLPALKNFKQFTDLQNYSHLPEDWYVVITDVVNSTKAIERGRYKDINMASALSLVAVINLNPKFNLPFVFGGDGITLLVSKPMLSDILSVLSDNRQLVKRTFNLVLRVGFVPVEDIYQAGYKLQVAKYQVSPTYSQILIFGEGIDYAESLIKSTQHGYNYLIPEDYEITNSANYTGFSCPFEDVRSSREEIISVIIKVRKEFFYNQHIFYKQVLDKVEFIFGSFEESHPLALSKLRFINSKSDRAKSLMNIQLDKKNGLAKILGMIAFKLLFVVTFSYAKIIYHFFDDKIHFLASSDYKKFDGTLKMTLACDQKQRIEFEKYLEKMKQEGKIYFGIHTSDRALITCLVGANEVHLVDSADGGYALAAKQLKKQIANYE
ncbi:DUF3095 family protein [Cronbergia sp. UHCC 0137]|uniref:DUF3095 family protein n=1 Tax=Cronbergia sp. UHCC 0137 TaxID=3110239 RepID=UPI002B206E4F|nr:DUF3095 family protein [Cronbergia sp. UHCC 0137]MEA5618006.1 DUF3095 family protein [Cronbergia sp. UHCC 0137]